MEKANLLHPDRFQWDNWAYSRGSWPKFLDNKLFDFVFFVFIIIFIKFYTIVTKVILKNIYRNLPVFVFSCFLLLLLVWPPKRYKVLVKNQKSVRN